MYSHKSSTAVSVSITTSMNATATTAFFNRVGCLSTSMASALLVAVCTRMGRPYTSKFFIANLETASTSGSSSTRRICHSLRNIVYSIHVLCNEPINNQSRFYLGIVRLVVWLTPNGLLFLITSLNSSISQ